MSTGGSRASSVPVVLWISSEGCGRAVGGRGGSGVASALVGDTAGRWASYLYFVTVTDGY